jgi:hypothetical protein
MDKENEKKIVEHLEEVQKLLSRDDKRYDSIQEILIDSRFKYVETSLKKR